jgi:N-methylhydantoinase A
MGLAIGIDAGGTFTDLIVRDSQTGETYSHKLSSTTSNPADAIVQGIEDLVARHDLAADTIDLVAHGTTVGTNTLLQRNGARIALVTTKGFRDLLEIGRQTRPLNYDMHTDFPPPLVPRHRRVELLERMDANGNVITSIADEDLESAIAEVLQSRPEAVAISFIFAYLNPLHERQVKHYIEAAAPGLFLSTSSEVQPEFREYERFSTTTLNAYLQPVMARYFDTLNHRLEKILPNARIAISRSNGGLMSLPLARSFPIRTALSGPASGVIGAIDLQRVASRPNAITFDMGGTSADVAMVRNYTCNYRHTSTIGGFPIRMSMLDIHTVGAGGGSVAWFDSDDLLKVGPRSAGAYPGPACYGLGGIDATVSDANLVLGRLPPGGLLGGTMRLYPELARKAIAKVTAPLGLSVEEGARGIIDIVISNMVRAIRVITVERGFDPRNFFLFAFGGAGPLHARQVAVNLGMSEILVPPLPGILCAHGALASRFKEDMVRTIKRELNGPADRGDIAASIAELLQDARRWAATEKFSDASLHTDVVLEMRYVGQNFELSVPIGPREINRLPSVDDLRRRFYLEHDRQYGFHADDGVIEVVNIRLTAEVLNIQKLPSGGSNAKRSSIANVDSRLVLFDHKTPHCTPVYERNRLQVGQQLIGPAVIDQSDTTTLLFPGDHLRVDDHLNLIMTVNP